LDRPGGSAGEDRHHGGRGIDRASLAIANQRVEQHRLALDITVSVWRTTGHGPNNFAVESFIDELAAVAKRDPVEFRRALLAEDKRALGVLDLVAQESGWGSPARDGASRGVALAKAFGGYVAAVAEVVVRDERVAVRRLIFAVDCGKLLDPGIATSNIQGGAVWGLSGMRTEITFARGGAEQMNFDTFEPLRLYEMPVIDVHFVASEEKPGGTGELGPVPVHAAVVNAIAAASGRRVRTLPLTTAGLSFA
jgi:isoquinoline 1-oxidoreductase beta subunit